MARQKIKKDNISKSNLLKIVIEKLAHYQNNLKIVEQEINKLKGQIVELEIKKYSLQGAITALSHIINKEG